MLLISRFSRTTWLRPDRTRRRLIVLLADVLLEAERAMCSHHVS